MFMEFTGKTVETMALWADANQRMLGEVVELGAGTAKEGAQLYADLQQTTLDAMRDAQGTMQRWQASWEVGLTDPMRWYQQALLESVEGTEKAFRALEAQAKAWSRSMERIQGSTERAGRSMQETYKSLVGRMKDVYTKN